jgi:site-specific DNA-cytosine methylase
MCLNAGGMKRQDSESETLIPTIGGGFDAQAFDWQSGGDSRGLDPKPTAQLQACQVPAVIHPAPEIAGTMKACKDSGGWSNSVDHAATGYMVPVGVTLHGTDGTASVASFTDLSSSLRSRIPSGVENSTTTAVMQPVAFADTAQTITAGFEFDYNDEKKAATHLIGSAMQVRRLTPEECEALQGFPRSYTQIPWRKKPASECPDGPRYKALGNSWAVPVARWIGERINKVEAWTS